MGSTPSAAGSMLSRKVIFSPSMLTHPVMMSPVPPARTGAKHAHMAVVGDCHRQPGAATKCNAGQLPFCWLAHHVRVRA